MAKPEWGTKRICPNCGARYYDMRKKTPVCPKCGTEFDAEAFLRSRRSRSASVEELKRPAARSTSRTGTEAEVDLGEELPDTGDDDKDAREDLDEDNEDALIEDASELGDDESVDGIDIDEDEET